MIFSKTTPAKAGYFMPAEWAKHEATWLTWPTNKITWPGTRLQNVENSYLQWIEALLPGEKVNLLVDDVETADRVYSICSQRKTNIGNLSIHIFKTVDSWIRDYGPVFLKNKKGEKAYVKWIFNAWGSKYKSLMRDNQVFEHGFLAKFPAFKPGIVMEGGSIEVNGAGTCLVTEQCQLNKNRNPHLNRKQIEKHLCDYLGVSQILWLKEGIVGDDTDGHIDDIARFIDETTIVSAYEENPSDENYPILKGNWEDLESFVRPNGRKWDLVKLPMPGRIEVKGIPLPASYANFYIGNEVVLVPAFKHKNDDRALKIIAELFPERDVIGIDARDMVYGLGTLHCLSQQEPV